MSHHMLRLFAPKPNGGDTEHVCVTLPDGSAVQVLRVRHARARRMKLSVDERGARLTLPPRASLRSADAFVQEHTEWLQRQLRHVHAEAIAGLAAGITSHLPLRGDALPVHWQPARVHRVLLEQQQLLFQYRSGVERRGNEAPSCPPTPAVRRALRDFYEAQARTDIAIWLPKYTPGLPRSPSRIALKPMTSQWGSLSPAGVVTLDLSLVLARPSAFEYVLVHELCHLIRGDHSRAYWREVETRFPAWREERAYFKREGRRLKAMLRTLTNP